MKLMFLTVVAFLALPNFIDSVLDYEFQPFDAFFGVVEGDTSELRYRRPAPFKFNARMLVTKAPPPPPKKKAAKKKALKKAPPPPKAVTRVVAAPPPPLKKSPPPPLKKSPPPPLKKSPPPPLKKSPPPPLKKSPPPPLKKSPPPPLKKSPPPPLKKSPPPPLLKSPPPPLLKSPPPPLLKSPPPPLLKSPPPPLLKSPPPPVLKSPPPPVLKSPPPPLLKSPPPPLLKSPPPPLLKSPPPPLQTSPPPPLQTSPPPPLQTSPPPPLQTSPPPLSSSPPPPTSPPPSLTPSPPPPSLPPPPPSPPPPTPSPPMPSPPSNRNTTPWDTYYMNNWTPKDPPGGLVLSTDQMHVDMKITSRNQIFGHFLTQNRFLYGYFSIWMKLIPNDSAGIIMTYYFSSPENHTKVNNVDQDTHDEMDFEFLGNVSGQPITLQTNAYLNGKGGREQRHYLPFDPSADFHKYSLLWNQHLVIWYVDDSVIRVHYNKGGVPFPTWRPMAATGSLWNGSDWATQGGTKKLNISNQPFILQYEGFGGVDGCQACVTNPFTDPSPACPMSPNNSYVASCQSGNWFNAQTELTATQVSQLQAHSQNYIVYNYCYDYGRYGGNPANVPPECQYNEPF